MYSTACFKLIYLTNNNLFSLRMTITQVLGSWFMYVERKIHVAWSICWFANDVRRIKIRILTPIHLYAVPCSLFFTLGSDYYYLKNLILEFICKLLVES